MWTRPPLATVARVQCLVSATREGSVFDGPGPEIPGELQDAVQVGAVLTLLAEKGVRPVPVGDGGGAVAL